MVAPAGERRHSGVFVVPQLLHIWPIGGVRAESGLGGAYWSAEVWGYGCRYRESESLFPYCSEDGASPPWFWARSVGAFAGVQVVAGGNGVDCRAAAPWEWSMRCCAASISSCERCRTRWAGVSADDVATAGASASWVGAAIFAVGWNILSSPWHEYWP